MGLERPQGFASNDNHEKWVPIESGRWKDRCNRVRSLANDLRELAETASNEIEDGRRQAELSAAMMLLTVALQDEFGPDA